MEVSTFLVFTTWLVSIHQCLSLNLNALSYLGERYRLNLIQFREDPLFGNRPILDEYDFIVVGSGASGATVARRLAEIPEWKILLLEAGKQESLATSVPAIAHYFQFTDFNWAFKTEEEPNACQGVVNKKCLWPQGKGLGGSTIINNNIYTRGNVRDFDRWAEAGNPGWSYKDVLPYFLKNEDVTIPELKRSPYHGVGGPMPISYSPFKSKLVETFLESAPQVGLNVVDYNDPNSHVGFSRIQGTINFGRRVTSARAYLRGNLTNLHIVDAAFVTKVLIDPNTKVTLGVEFEKNNRRRRALARKEVILSAGAFNSAKLLMLSGIGPKEHLEPLGINTISDLRVGDNLQEHPSYANLAFTVNQTVGLIPDRIYKRGIRELFNFNDGNGWLTTMGCEGLGYIKTKYNKDPGDIPDIEYIFIPMSLAGEEGLGNSLLRRSMGIPDRTHYDLHKGIFNKDGWTIWTMLMYPESTGQVRLRNANPYSKPLIRANFFDAPVDVLRIVEGIKSVIELNKTPAFQKLGSKMSLRTVPGCRHLSYGSDAYWECCVKRLTMQMHHQCCTAKMGPSFDRNAVVNSQLMVYGVSKLRVIDCSIMPSITGAHTVAPAYMIGEKGADLVKSTWLRPIS
ncbi:PREDICTED: glucose dehydrogenase [FAD, quinone]-like [Diuraphis noxia]|uniref:glucose dehydrogenase [FAD, quinone]-like n=1 Tax=Diuraphis noxia TaxID=143948 RepID=UPI000763AAB2|nr:PREDICTED: glucose dehydrogenase [FAD, quinone]-like [Diuraphis noxia]XP_015370219.1 PREDICTED: glucose dehydrogenase [FAD, quinone]-like [Diuraphis noxia]XP_015370220.1 PREDICTED: glucose dehydrogenase [FAD, quinone]-like [Diuraphis noxia]